jgi:hypothetical protein
MRSFTCRHYYLTSSSPDDSDYPDAIIKMMPLSTDVYIWPKGFFLEAISCFEKYFVFLVLMKKKQGKKSK